MARRRIPHEHSRRTPDPFVAIGLDAEWVLESVGRNLILQLSVLRAQRRQRSDDDADHLSEKRQAHHARERPDASDAQGAARSASSTRCRTGSSSPAHFTRADLTTFADFGCFKRGIGAVRKSYATTERPLQLRLASNEGPVRCSATVVDTMMLSPAGTSLEKLGKLLGVPKIELPEGYSKDRMDLFLRDHPEKFEEYALTDAVIPAMWVAQIYGLLLDRLGIKKKVITLGGAAVELVKRASEGMRNRPARISRTGQKEEAAAGAPGVDVIATAAQAYHGGYNVAAALGFSPEGKELYRPRHPVGLHDGAGVHRRSRLARRATMRRAGRAGGGR